MPARNMMLLIASFVLSFLTGAGVTYLTCAHVHEKEMAALQQQKMEAQQKEEGRWRDYYDYMSEKRRKKENKDTE